MYKFVSGAIILVLIASVRSSTSIKGNVLQIKASAIQQLSQTFNHMMILFLQEPHNATQTLYERHVKQIHEQHPDDNTLYGVTYLSKDQQGHLEKFNKNQGFRIITSRNFYELDLGQKLDHFSRLSTFYSRYVHPVLNILVKQQFATIDTSIFVVMEYNSSESLRQFIHIYPKIYDYLKTFRVRAVAVESTKNSTKVHIYNKQNLQLPTATYGGDINNTDQLIDFINVQTLEPLTLLNDENYIRVFGSLLDTQLLFIYDQKDQNLAQIQQVRANLKQTAIYNKQQQLKYQRILFVEANLQFLSKYFDDSIRSMIDEQQNPLNYKIILTQTDYGQFQLRKFNYNTKIYQNILKFIQDVRMKRLDSQYLSQKIPTQNQQNQVLRKIVGKTFIKQIFQRKQSIIVLFIDSKEQSSYKDIKQAFENFTKDNKQSLKGKVISAIFDLAKNQNKMLSIRRAPLLTLFDKTNKKVPKHYKGNAKPQSIQDWINYQLKEVTLLESQKAEIQTIQQKPLAIGLASHTQQVNKQL